MTKDSRLFDRLCGHGDIREIANITGFNVSYVRKVLDNQRSNSLIYDIANDLITMRDRIRRKYKTLINESGKERTFTKARDVENLLLDLQFRPTRSLIEDAMRLLHAEQRHPHREALVRAREKVTLYDRHILESLDWLNLQRVQIEPVMGHQALWPMVRYATSFLQDTVPGITLTLQEENPSLSVVADPHLMGGLIRALVYHLHRITAPDGEVYVQARETDQDILLVIESRPCLLNEHTFDMLKDRYSLKVTRPHADNLEAVAVAGYFVMELHDGSMTWKKTPDRTGSVTLAFDKKVVFPNS